ncbi:MAG: phage tail sheath protein [Candidatus Eremiobacteraeota bacterium]|nr:phage tail sheath protein [Candidatus Eremiobacteraeota bacterium]
MPVLTTYPGVYIEEIPSGVHTITGVATSITAFVGRALRGPVNQPVTITSFADYQRTFGGLWQLSSMSFAVRDFFENGGSLAIIVRAFNPAAPAAAAAAVGADVGAQQLFATLPGFLTPTPASVAAAGKNALPSPPKSAASQTAVDDVVTAARVPGTTVQSVVDAFQKAVDASAKAANDAAAAAVAAAGAKTTPAPTAADVAKAAQPAAGTTPSAAAAAVAKAAIDAVAATTPAPQTVLDAVNKAAAAPDPDLAPVLAAAKVATAPGGKDVPVLLHAQAGANPTPAQTVLTAAADAKIAGKPTATAQEIVTAVETAFGTDLPTPGPVPSQSAKARIVLGRLTLEAAGEGSWGRNLRARVDALSGVKGLSGDQRNAIADGLGVSIGDVFTLTVHENGGATEQFANVTVLPSIRRIDKILESSAFVRVAGAPGTAPPPPSAGDMPTKDPWPDGDGSSTPPIGGSDGGPLEAKDIIDTGGINGLFSLAKADLFNILVIPPPVPGDDAAYKQIVPAAVKYCEDRRAFMIIDPPSAWTSIGAVTQAAQSSPPVTQAASNHAAIYFPTLRKGNPLAKNQIQDFPPSGSVAGIYARTDAQRGVWKAPAGLEATLTDTVGLALEMNDLENGELNQLGVNCLRIKPAVGPVVWGARTAAGDDRLASEWKYIPVRRTALFLEESLYRGTQWVVFEPNDEPLWSQIRLNVGAFMQSLFRQGAFQGLTPKDAYFVHCDSTTTTQNDINNGIVNIIVGFAPLKPAEFVVIQIQQIAGQIKT